MEGVGGYILSKTIQTSRTAAVVDAGFGFDWGWCLQGRRFSLAWYAAFWSGGGGGGDAGGGD